MAGSTGRPSGTTAWNLRRYFRSPVPLTKVGYWTQSDVAPEVGPELPALLEVPALPAVLPLGTSGGTSGAQYRLQKLGTGLNGSGTGS